MAIAISTGSNNIYAPKETYLASSQLAQSFCHCPEAKNLLDKVASSIKIILQVGNFETASTTPISSSEALISIPERSKSVQNQELSLAFELTNTINHKQFDPIFEQAEQGKIGLNPFAKAIESIEAEASLQRIDFKNRCKKPWKMKPKLARFGDREEVHIF